MILSRWLQSAAVVCLILLVACSSGEEVDLSRTTPPERVLECGRVSTERINWNGGKVRTRSHEIDFGLWDVGGDPAVTLTSAGGDTIGVRVRFDPQPTEFEATLIFDLTGCPDSIQRNRSWIVWRYPDEGEQGDTVPLSTQWKKGGRQRVAEIGENSGFMIAN